MSTKIKTNSKLKKNQFKNQKAYTQRKKNNINDNHKTISRKFTHAKIIIEIEIHTQKTKVNKQLQNN